MKALMFMAVLLLAAAPAYATAYVSSGDLLWCYSCWADPSVTIFIGDSLRIENDLGHGLPSGSSAYFGFGRVPTDVNGVTVDGGMTFNFTYDPIDESSWHPGEEFIGSTWFTMTGSVNLPGFMNTDIAGSGIFTEHIGPVTSFDFEFVPEPSILLMMLTGLLAIGLRLKASMSYLRQFRTLRR